METRIVCSNKILKHDSDNPSDSKIANSYLEDSIFFNAGGESENSIFYIDDGVSEKFALEIFDIDAKPNLPIQISFESKKLKKLYTNDEEEGWEDNENTDNNNLKKPIILEKSPQGRFEKVLLI